MTDDEDIADRLRTGQAGATDTLELLYTRYASGLRSELVSQGLDEPTARGIVQTTLDAVPRFPADFYRGVRNAGGIAPLPRSVAESAANDVRRYRRGASVSAAFRAGLDRAQRRDSFVNF